MRRREVWPDVPPALLCRFNSADWPAGNDLAAYVEWREARETFAEVHGWPGDEVVMLQEARAERRRHFNHVEGGS